MFVPEFVSASTVAAAAACVGGFNFAVARRANDSVDPTFERHEGYVAPYDSGASDVLLAAKSALQTPKTVSLKT